MGSGERSDGGFWRTGLGVLTQIGAVLAAVAAIVGGLAALTGGGGSGEAQPEPRLELVDLAVAGGRAVHCPEDPPDPPRLDLTVRNTGDQPAVITRLGLRVRATGLLSIPQAGGGLEPSRAYDVLLPGDARAGQLLRYKVSQEIGSRESDRFVVRLDETEPERQLGVRLYQLDVLLYHDTAAEPLDAGTVLVGVPHVPDKKLFWAGVPAAYRAGYAGSPARATMDDNERTYRRMLTLAGSRPPEIDAALVDVPVTGTESGFCRPDGTSRTAQAPLVDD